jgi:hypothetical protein
MRYRRTVMKAIPFVALGTVILVAGCESIMPQSAPPRTEAYRAHSDEPITGATIAIGPANLARANDPLVRAGVTAVGSELAALGFASVADAR